MIDAYTALGMGWRIAIVVGAAVLTSGGGMFVLAQLPADHFVSRPHVDDTWWRRNLAVWWTLRVVKNLAGMVFLPLGIVLSLPFVPGPGLVFIILGLSLLDFPGKRRIERRLLRLRHVSHFLTRARHHFGKDPFIMEKDHPP